MNIDRGELRRTINAINRPTERELRERAVKALEKLAAEKRKEEVKS